MGLDFYMYFSSVGMESNHAIKIHTNKYRRCVSIDKESQEKKVGRGTASKDFMKKTTSGLKFKDLNR